MIVIRSNHSIHISDEVLFILDKYKQNHYQNESGGIILGYVYEDNNIYISKISEPNSSDKASRYRFERDRKAAQIIVNSEFYKSEGKVIYLGEWHTHPEPIPSPSFTDIKMIKEQYKNNRINESFLILIIQGTTDLYLGLYNGKQLINN
ncbi:MAG: peptidase [Bacteroidales bacterium]|nr:peptidase [Bacteroidales bacterium]